MTASTVLHHVIYHRDCPDGFAAAYAARQHLPHRLTAFHPARHGEPPPDGMAPGSRIYILDFAYPRPVIAALQERHGRENVIIRDHHITAREALFGLPGNIVVDPSFSGAVLAWRYFTNLPLPTLYAYIQDRDLWQWQLPHSAAVNAVIQSTPMEWPAYDDLLERLAAPDGVESVAAAGADVLAAQMAEQAMRTELDGLPCASLNAGILNSELGEFLLQDPAVAVAQIWSRQADGRIRVSLRSRADGPDVSAMAQKRGGGGHRNAAGYTVDSVAELDKG